MIFGLSLVSNNYYILWWLELFLQILVHCEISYYLPIYNSSKIARGYFQVDAFIYSCRHTTTTLRGTPRLVSPT